MPKLRKALSDDERAIAADIRENFGGSLTATDVAEYFGISLNTAKKWLRGVSYVVFNNRKVWLVSDVARKIYEDKVMV